MCCRGGGGGGGGGANRRASLEVPSGGDGAVVAAGTLPLPHMPGHHSDSENDDGHPNANHQPLTGFPAGLLAAAGGGGGPVLIGGRRGTAVRVEGGRVHVNGKEFSPSRFNLVKFMVGPGAAARGRRGGIMVRVVIHGVYAPFPRSQHAPTCLTGPDLNGPQVPLALWVITLIIIYVVSYIKLEGMQWPLASLNIATHVVYRYTRIRCAAACGAAWGRLVPVCSGRHGPHDKGA